jgi:hypothetical protein
MSEMTNFKSSRAIFSVTSWVTRCALLALSAAAVFGQTFGEITGRLSDATGASIPSAAVTLTNLNTNAVRTTVSTGAGGYSLPSVPPGFYNIKVECPGFKAAVANNVEVQVQQTVRLDFTLSVGQISESVEVQATADQLAQENATVGTVIGTGASSNFRLTDVHT